MNIHVITTAHDQQKRPCRVCSDVGETTPSTCVIMCHDEPELRIFLCDECRRHLIAELNTIERTPS